MGTVTTCMQPDAFVGPAYKLAVQPSIEKKMVGSDLDVGRGLSLYFFIFLILRLIVRLVYQRT
jgi:hypothetical protein